MSNPLLTGMGAIFAQRYGEPNTPEYLGCHSVTDYAIPKGDVTLIRCPDPSATGKFKVVGSFESVPGNPTFTLATILYGAADYLEDWPCIGNIIVNKQECGRRDLPSNWIRRFVMYHSHITNESGDVVVDRDGEANGPTTITFSLTPEEILKIFQVSAGVSGIAAATGALSCIAVCNVPRCGGQCGDAMEACEVLWVGTNIAAGSTLDKAEVFYSIDGGVTWTPAATQPFAAGESINAIVCFPIDNTTTRIMVMRGTTDAGNGPEIAYSDDGGATWTVVEILATHALFGQYPYSLFALDYFHIWAVTDKGGIAFSDDGGATWTQQGLGVTIADLDGVKFANASVGYAVGTSGVVLKTIDGGATWAILATIPAAYAAVMFSALEVLSEQALWITAFDGTLIYSADGGATWTIRHPAGATYLQVIAFSHPMVGWVFGGGSIAGNLGWRTTDGGATWDSLSVPATVVGAYHFQPCTLNSGVLVGGDTDTGVFAKFNPV
jgi:hypothetical protein